MAIDIKRRKAVMSRSIKLGHCVCNPRKPCPCPTFQEHNVCECAGERMPIKPGPTPLTRHVRKAGCASKIGQADLLRILGNLPEITDPNVLIGASAGDDAGVYRLDDERSLVQTVDVFTPCVDDPYLFGQIAAANSLSDIYAMGAEPLTALSIIGFPIDTLDGSVMEAILRGGIDKLNEAGCALLGGHSINDEEIKCGFAVTGVLPTSEVVVERDNAQVGDLLVITKPLGTGMISFAAQIGYVSAACLDETGRWMATLNRDAGRLMVEHGASAATDVTGFGLMGHLVEMARKSGVSVELDMSKIPVFAPVVDCLANQVIGGAVERNQEYSMAWARVEDMSGEANLPLLYDPQTSGGLLVALPEAKAQGFVDAMRALDQGAVAIIGRVVERVGDKSEVVVVNSHLANFIGEREGAILIKNSVAATAAKSMDVVKPKDESESSPNAPLSCCGGESPATAREEAPACCASPPAGASAEKPSASARETNVSAPDKFLDFLKSANQPQAIEPRAKKLMAVALSVARACDPCLKIHVKGALDMGISIEEIDEAAWLAISFSGSPAMMFYNGVKKELRI